MSMIMNTYRRLLCSKADKWTFVRVCLSINSGKSSCMSTKPTSPGVLVAMLGVCFACPVRPYGQKSSLGSWCSDWHNVLQAHSLTLLLICCLTLVLAWDWRLSDTTSGAAIPLWRQQTACGHMQQSQAWSWQMVHMIGPW